MLDGQAIRAHAAKVLDIFAVDIASIRTGRASSGLIENVIVQVYEGKKMRLLELGSIGVPDARTLTFTPWDQSIIKEVKNGIAAANLGMNPEVDGQLIRMSLPVLTVEQREEYVKLLGRKLEGARGLLRNVRMEERRALQEAKQKKEVSENEFAMDEKNLQLITDEFMEKLSEMAEKKEKEIRGE